MKCALIMTTILAIAKAIPMGIFNNTNIEPIHENNTRFPITEKNITIPKYNATTIPHIVQNFTYIPTTEAEKNITSPNYNTTSIPHIVQKSTVIPTTEATKPNKMIIKCNINKDTESWRRKNYNSIRVIYGGGPEEYLPYLLNPDKINNRIMNTKSYVKTHVFTDKERFENSRCCDYAMMAYKIILITRGILVDLGGDSSYANKVRTNKNRFCSNTIYPKQFDSLIICCKDLDPESTTGCNFFNFKVYPNPNNPLCGRCISLGETNLSKPGSTDMTYKPYTTKPTSTVAITDSLPTEINTLSTVQDKIFTIDTATNSSFNNFLYITPTTTSNSKKTIIITCSVVIGCAVVVLVITYCIKKKSNKRTVNCIEEELINEDEL